MTNSDKLKIQMDVLKKISDSIPKRKHSRFRDGDEAIDFFRDLIEFILPEEFEMEAIERRRQTKKNKLSN